MREANIRDGAAVIQYLSWLNRTIDTERVTEFTGATKLAQFRELIHEVYFPFRDINFDFI